MKIPGLRCRRRRLLSAQVDADQITEGVAKVEQAVGQHRVGPDEAALLVWQVLLANLGVARLVLHPRMPIDPVLLRFRTGWENSLPKVMLGNSITLTPGTFTIRIVDDVFLIHAIHEDLAASLLDGSMQRKVAEVYGETLVDDMEMTVIRDAATFCEEEQK